jgi:hypothetical protein
MEGDCAGGVGVGGDDQGRVEQQDGHGGVPGAVFDLEHAARALTRLQQGTNGQAVVLRPGPARS